MKQQPAKAEKTLDWTDWYWGEREHNPLVEFRGLSDASQHFEAMAIFRTKNRQLVMATVTEVRQLDRDLCEKIRPIAGMSAPSPALIQSVEKQRVVLNEAFEMWNDRRIYGDKLPAEARSSAIDAGAAEAEASALFKKLAHTSRATHEQRLHQSENARDAVTVLLNALTGYASAAVMKRNASLEKARAALAAKRKAGRGPGVA